jgi:hypothetical protein
LVKDYQYNDVSAKGDINYTDNVDEVVKDTKGSGSLSAYVMPNGKILYAPMDQGHDWLASDVLKISNENNAMDYGLVRIDSAQIDNDVTAPYTQLSVNAQTKPTKQQLDTIMSLSKKAGMVTYEFSNGESNSSMDSGLFVEGMYSGKKSNTFKRLIDAIYAKAPANADRQMIEGLNQQVDELSDLNMGVTKNVQANIPTPESVQANIPVPKDYIPKVSEMKQIDGDMVKKFGITDNPLEVAYITKDGDWIDGSGKTIGGSPGERTLDHRELVSEVSKKAGDGTDLMIEYQNGGGLRATVNRDQIGLDVVRTPTKSQLESLRLIEAKMPGVPIYVDISNTHGGLDSSKEFTKMDEAIKFINKSTGGKIQVNIPQPLDYTPTTSSLDLKPSQVQQRVKEALKANDITPHEFNGKMTNYFINPDGKVFEPPGSGADHEEFIKQTGMLKGKLNWISIGDWLDATNTIRVSQPVSGTNEWNIQIGNNQPTAAQMSTLSKFNDGGALINADIGTEPNAFPNQTSKKFVPGIARITELSRAISDVLGGLEIP